MKVLSRWLSPWLALSFAVAPLPAQKEYQPADKEEEFQRRYRERITKDYLNGVYIPKNLNDAIAQLNQKMEEPLRRRIQALSEDSVCIYLHARLGQWMIVHWGFYEGSRLSHYLRSAGITYPDDMADFLIIAFHRHLNQRPVEVRELATYFKEKRKKEWQERLSKGQVLHREVRQRPRPDTLAPPASAVPKTSKGQ